MAEIKDLMDQYHNIKDVWDRYGKTPIVYFTI